MTAKGDLNDVAPVFSKLEIYLKRITVNCWPDPDLANCQPVWQECPSCSFPQPALFYFQFSSARMEDPANDLVYDMLKAVSSRARHSVDARVDFKETLQPAWLVFPSSHLDI